MTIAALREQIPDYAEDVRLNLCTLNTETTLTNQQKYGTFLASALARGNRTVVKAIEDEVSNKLSEEAKTAAKVAAGLIGMNNFHYPAIYLMSTKECSPLQTKLRMNALGNPGVEKVDFELWAFAVSAINGCSTCLDFHETELRKHGINTEQIQTTLRIAAAIYITAAILDTEGGLG